MARDSSSNQLRGARDLEINGPTDLPSGLPRKVAFRTEVKGLPSIGGPKSCPIQPYFGRDPQKRAPTFWNFPGHPLGTGVPSREVGIVKFGFWIGLFIAARGPEGSKIAITFRTKLPLIKGFIGCMYHTGIIIGRGIWPQFCGSCSP